MRDRSAPLKRFVDSARPITYGIVQAGEHVPDGVPYIRPVDMTDSDGVPDPDQLLRTSHDIAATYSRSEVRAGDLIVSIGPSFGKLMIIPKELSGANLTQGTARVAPASGVDVRWVYWALQSEHVRSFWSSAVGGATFRALNLGPLAATPLPVVGLEVQRAVARFLDRETARIDELIHQSRELVRLVELRRGALRANALLGLIGRFPERVATGDRTLPELPGGWRPVRLRHVAREITVGVVVTPAAFYVDEGLPFIRGYNVRPGLVTDDDLVRISPEGNAAHPKSVLRPGDVLVVRTGQAGAASVVPDWAVGGNCVDVLIARCGPSLRPEFLEAVLNSEPSARQIEAMSVGAIQSHFNVSALQELVLPLPPIDHQDRVLRILDEEDARMVALVEFGERQIELLRERRQAMIAAAVSGQLNVDRAA